MLPSSITFSIDEIVSKISLTVQCDENEVLKIDKKSVFTSILGFTDNEYRIENYISKKFVFITGIDKIRLICDRIDGSFVNGRRQPILYVFCIRSTTWL